MKMYAMLLIVTELLAPSLSDARCRDLAESASMGSECGTFLLYPAERVVEEGQKRESVALRWLGYGIGVPLFIVTIPVAMAGAGVGAALHPWTTCIETEGLIADERGSAHRGSAAVDSGMTPPSRKPIVE